MEKISLNIKMLYPRMSKAEKKIADWNIANPGEIISLSIIELAERCACSEATIVRFAKHLGFNGYQELKISLAQETNTTTVSTDITSEDNASDIYDKVCNEIYCSLELTKKTQNTESLEAACKAILQAKRIVVLGLGNSASIALDLSHKLLRAGCDACAYSDNHMQMIAVSHLTAEDVIVAISHSGSSKDIVDALKFAKSRDVKTICITNYGKSPIQKFSDTVLYTSSDETKHSILALSSRIAQLAIVNVIYYYIVYHSDKEVMEQIKNSELALMSKKY